tara:strand:+ start:3479 stop:3949 length:471 start_codon:yes stop_codon:yes gene_type:complete
MNDFERLIDDLDPVKGGPLTTLTNPERHDVARFIEQLRLWGKYNMVMTDLSPFLTDAKSVIEGELAQEILLYAKETEEFPVNMSEFMENQPEPLRYIWENSQKMRDLMTRATLRFMESQNLGMDDKNINDVFKMLSRKIYQSILRGPYLPRVQSKR